MISKFQAKTSLYFITATGIATTLTFHSLNPNSSLTDSPPLSSSAPNIKTALNGVVRSSRALFTVCSFFLSPYLHHKFVRNQCFPSVIAHIICYRSIHLFILFASKFYWKSMFVSFIIARLIWYRLLRMLLITSILYIDCRWSLMSIYKCWLRFAISLLCAIF